MPYTDFTRGGVSPSVWVLPCTSSWPNQSLPLISGAHRSSQWSPLKKMGHWCPTSILASLPSALSRFVYKYQLLAFCYANFVFPFRSPHYIFLLIHHIVPHTNPSVFPITFSTLVVQSPEIFNFHRCIFPLSSLSLDNSGNRVLLQWDHSAGSVGNTWFSSQLHK